MDILKLLVSFISGGVLLELLKLFYPDIKKILNNKIEAKNIYNKHSDLILKAADELFGKLYSLAEEDFISLTRNEPEQDEMNKIYIIYLFASFWASLGILRRESSYVHLARIRNGKRLLNFVTTYEAKKNRILERSYQRAIGDSVIIQSQEGLRIMSLYDFVNEYKKDSSLKKMIQPLEDSLLKTGDKQHRQKFLIFGIIILALIDFLDRKHLVVRDRLSYSNKLNVKSKIQIRRRIFGHYLPFIKGVVKYYK